MSPANLCRPSESSRRWASAQPRSGRRPCGANRCSSRRSRRSVADRFRESKVRTQGHTHVHGRDRCREGLASFSSQQCGPIALVQQSRVFPVLQLCPRGLGPFSLRRRWPAPSRREGPGLQLLRRKCPRARDHQQPATCTDRSAETRFSSGVIHWLTKNESPILRFSFCSFGTISPARAGQLVPNDRRSVITSSHPGCSPARAGRTHPSGARAGFEKRGTAA
jgi:hypothetical protein